MRKFFYFLLAAVTVVLTACGDGNEPDNGGKRFAVTVSGNNMDDFRITLTPKDLNMPYWYVFGNPDVVKNITSASLEEDLLSWDLKYPEDYFKGKNSLQLHNWMSPNTEYVIIVYPVYEGGRVKEFEVTPFTTPSH